jgi:hypothetical protein
MGENQHWQNEIVVYWEGLFRKITEQLEHRWQHRWIFILKTLFPHKLSDISFTKPISAARLQLLNLWILKVMLGCVNDGVTTIKPRHQENQKIENAWYCQMSCPSRWSLHHEGLCVENTQVNLDSGILDSNSETRRRFYVGLGSNILAQYSVCPIITLHGRIVTMDYVDGLVNQVQLMIKTLFPNVAVFQDDNAPIHTAITVQLWF